MPHQRLPVLMLSQRGDLDGAHAGYRRHAGSRSTERAATAPLGDPGWRAERRG